MDDPNWPRILDGLSTLWIMDLKAGGASGTEKLKWHEALCLLNMDTNMTAKTCGILTPIS